MVAILDACAMIAYLRDEKGAEVVEQLLLNEAVPCYAHAINVCEVYYNFLRVVGTEKATDAINDLQDIGLIINENLDNTIWQTAGNFKANHKLSLADCFAIAITKHLDGELVTSDHHEFDPIHEAGLCKINFFR